MSPRARKPSIYTVAAAAGTSVGTVSNVLNHPERVSPALRARVEAAMAEQRYWPDATARALILGRTSLVGTIYFDLSNPFFAESAHRLDKLVQARGSSLMVAATEHDPQAEQRAIQSLARVGADAVVVCSTGSCFDDLATLQERGTPVVLQAQRSEDDRFPAVHVDDRGGMQLIARHLLDQGVERFCYINKPLHAIQHRDRWDGFSEELNTRGHDLEQVHRLTARPDLDAGFDTAEEILAGPRKTWPEAIVCPNDFTAVGVCAAVERAGLAVGRDIAVTGFDDIPYASMLASPLTTIRQPQAEMSEHIVEQVFGAIQRGDTAVQPRTFEAELVRRRSA